MAPIREYMKLARVEYIGFAYMAVLGALAVVGHGAGLALFVPIVFVNVLALVWTFAHNDYCDLALDQMSEELDERVLVSGAVSRRGAIVLIVATLLPALIVGAVAFGSWIPGLVLALSFAFAFIYNMYSKRMPGADFLFAASSACLCLFGVCAAAAAEQLQIPAIAWCLVAIVFVEHLFFNMIEGGLKDVDVDGKGEAQTVARGLVHCDGDGRIHVGAAFRAIAYGLKAITVGLAFLPFVLLAEHGSNLQLAIMAVNAGLAFYYTHRLVTLRRYDWRRMGSHILKQEMAARALLPLMLLDRIGWGWAIGILAAPAVWHTCTVWFVHRRLFALPKRF